LLRRQRRVQGCSQKFFEVGLLKFFVWTAKFRGGFWDFFSKTPSKSMKFFIKGVIKHPNYTPGYAPGRVTPKTQYPRPNMSLYLLFETIKITEYFSKTIHQFRIFNIQTFPQKLKFRAWKQVKNPHYHKTISSDYINKMFHNFP